MSASYCRLVPFLGWCCKASPNIKNTYSNILISISLSQLSYILPCIYLFVFQFNWLFKFFSSFTSHIISTSQKKSSSFRKQTLPFLLIPLCISRSSFFLCCSLQSWPLPTSFPENTTFFVLSSTLQKVPFLYIYICMPNGDFSVLIGGVFILSTGGYYGEIKLETWLCVDWFWVYCECLVLVLDYS